MTSEKCGELVSIDCFRAHCDGATFAKYEQRLVAHFVEQTPSLRACPNPRCNMLGHCSERHLEEIAGKAPGALAAAGAGASGGGGGGGGAAPAEMRLPIVVCAEAADGGGGGGGEQEVEGGASGNGGGGDGGGGGGGGCGGEWCFRCGEEPHLPASCERVTQWNSTSADQDRNEQFIRANTKNCPKCNVQIFQDGGCLHMTCKHCGCHFCWLCLTTPYHSSDAGGYYRCNKFEERLKTEGLSAEERERAVATHRLKKYNHSFDRFLHHKTAHADASTSLRRTIGRRKTQLVALHFNGSALGFLDAAIGEVLTCRRVLAWTYVHKHFEYISQENSHVSERRQHELNLFEDIQGNLEQNTDDLHNLLDGSEQGGAGGADDGGHGGGETPAYGAAAGAAAAGGDDALPSLAAIAEQKPHNQRYSSESAQWQGFVVRCGRLTKVRRGAGGGGGMVVIHSSCVVALPGAPRCCCCCC
jgi:hypothetical protein